jgi:tetratricopeptide (TPR) repeat protein
MTSDDPYLLCWLGVAEGELGNDGAAYEAFRRCIEQDPQDPNILAMAGAGLAQFDDPDAETALRAAALSAPDLPIARLNYGAYLARAGLFEEALEQLVAARDLSPDDPVVRAELGAAHVLRASTAGIGELEEALVLAVDDSWTRVLYGLVLVELDRKEEAAEELVRAGRERPDDAEAMVLGALAAASVGWEDPAEELLARAEYAAEGSTPAAGGGGGRRGAERPRPASCFGRPRPHGAAGKAGPAAVTRARARPREWSSP